MSIQYKVLEGVDAFYGDPLAIGKQVTVETMPPDLFDKIADDMLFKQCHNNAWHVATAFYSFGHDVKYVAGRADRIIPVDHGWVKIDGAYYDPTWQRFNHLNDVTYYAIAELSARELMQVVLANDDYPPSAHDMLQKHGDFIVRALSNAL